MMKCEFETMIGKEVTAETFDLYQNMYLSTPSNVSKQEFVKMLNIEAIPESPAAIERRAKRVEFVKEYIEKIEKLKHNVKKSEEAIQWYNECLKDSIAKNDGDVEYYTREIQWLKKQIKSYKAQIKEYKLIIE